MNKAYDRVEWDFLEVILRMMGFGETWIDWIMKCVKIVSYSLVVNRKPSCRINPSRGIRQKDPLSLYLFVLAINVLSKMLDAAANHGVFKFHNKCKKVQLTHLCFADDLFDICKRG